MNRAFAHLGRFRRSFIAGFLGVATLVGASLVDSSVAELNGPAKDERHVTFNVTTILRREHLSKHPLDDEISQRCLRTFLKTLDPMKLYFLQSDIDGFSAREFELDDLAKKNDGSFNKFGYTIFNTFLQRIDERVKRVDALVDANHDYTVDEDIVTDAKLTTYAKTQEELNDKWRRRIKYDLLMQKAEKLAAKSDREKDSAAGKKNDADDKIANMTEQEGREKIKRRYHSFAKRMHQISNDELLEMYLTAMTTGFDPHTTYMSSSTYENFGIQMRLKLEGIGAALEFNDGYTIVKKLIPGGAAEKDGRLKPEDRVTGVGQGVDGEIVETTDMSLNDVVKLIRGAPGTVVRLKVIPPGQPEPKILNITRASIELKDSEARSEIFEEGLKQNGTPYKVGVIDLPSFYMDMDGARAGANDFKSTTRDVRKILDEFKSKKVDAVILDLRRNGGGSLTEAISLTGLFIDEGPIVQVKDSNGKVQHYDDNERGVAWNGPLVVLTSKFSASASEIFAGAVQDYNRGLIVGDKTTHGKGTVQSLLDLGQQLFRSPNAPKLGALKITMQQFYRPSGDSTQNRGVLSDVEIPSLTTHLDVGESDLDFAIKFDRVDAVPFAKGRDVDPQTVQQLNTLSKQRVDGSEEFQKAIRNIERYKKQKQNKKISLNEKSFLADRAELNADREEEKEFEQLNNTTGPVVKRDYYFNEALAITLDYLKLNRLAAR